MKEDLRLCSVDSANWRDIVALRTSSAQEAFIESNAVSIVESMYDREHAWQCFGLYRNDEACGFVMVGAHNASDRYAWLDRFMIDDRYQGQGLGKAFLHVVVEYMWRSFDIDEIVLSVTPANVPAKRFYERNGFEPTGLIDPENSEEIMRMLVSRN
ncbi:GNAT family N-acetyltransferase [Paenalkalicoccus suaedae]|uniref:GNAT family N-acetyltransferase n=1 Tax=Paenalkalicoccus suaedae TaxID=2592382 RepID=A0A859FA66_9BACI|nr:GNAT family N-acetyltransferase [Paenalkalicoccus suaedae]QKS69780.1 GNAT family N-acetyltransferase [Paenalkalicoccus suaedae]